MRGTDGKTRIPNDEIRSCRRAEPIGLRISAYQVSIGAGRLFSSAAGGCGEGGGAGGGKALASIPSAMLEQEEQTFGLRDSAFPVSDIGWPQHLQILGFIPATLILSSLSLLLNRFFRLPY
ncbi:MAG: hypothetical protein C5B50_13330 [Verrucomicrobia bacterium]|nr:MAG: hypothetical protein C5B50_13330 [Verrucomicrobiota bacterium]